MNDSPPELPDPMSGCGPCAGTVVWQAITVDAIDAGPERSPGAGRITRVTDRDREGSRETGKCKGHF